MPSKVSITTTHNQQPLIDICLDSVSIQFDASGTRMRSNPSRFSLLLREIPKETPVEQIIELFEKGDCPNCDSCEFAGNSFWYANFLSEADARTAFAYLSGKQFLGAPIKVRKAIANARVFTEA